MARFFVGREKTKVGKGMARVFVVREKTKEGKEVEQEVLRQQRKEKKKGFSLMEPES